MRCSEKILLDTRSLTLLPNNPRKISQESLNRLCDSIRDNGYWPHRPIAVEREPGTEDRYVVLDGNQRVKAMRRLKRREIPATIYEDMTEEERTDLILRSNINNGEWDIEILSAEYEGQDFESIGLQVELPEAVDLTAAPGGGETESQTKEDQPDGGADSSGDDDTDDTAINEDKLAFYHRMLGDYLYPSGCE